MKDNISRTELRQVDHAINNAIDHYIESRRAKIPEFINKYFSVKNAIKLHKKALGSDLYKGPINIFWSLPYTVLKTSASIIGKAGIKKIPLKVDKFEIFT